MDSKPIASEVAQPHSLSSRVFFFINKRRLKIWLWWCLAALIIAASGFIEIRTSILQSWIFTSTNVRLHFEMAAGPSASVVFPRSAPFDDRRGYSKLPAFQSRLQSLGYHVSRQARQSEPLVSLIERGISPPYVTSPDTGLDISGGDSMPLFRYAQSDFLFKKINDIPPLLVKTLLFLENRDLNRSAFPWQNPAIEWDRLFKAALTYAGSKLYLSGPVQGGSTLAVQLEKFRHSPNGRTDTPAEKLRQMIGASLKAYREGANTRAWRERIIVDYFNTVPLAAAPGYGEIHGLGEGLHAWFGVQLADAVTALTAPGITRPKVRAFKQALTLLISVRAPSVYLVEERSSLEEKVGQFARLMARAGIIDWELATAVQETPIQFWPAAPLPPQPSSVKNKAANAIRTSMMELLGVSNLYDLDRLDLEVQSTIDVPMQKKVASFLQSLLDPEVVKSLGLDGERLLENSDPKRVVYSVLLIEPTADGNLVRVQADSLPGPLDFNKSVKLELGSTAKLRTLTHYLEIVAELHKQLIGLDGAALREKARIARDPITQWAVASVLNEKNIALEAFLERAMERRYSASPYESFFTGGGLHHFENFDPEDNSRVPTLHDGFRNSTNLVFIRLMRDLVSYHRARLPYNAEAALSHPEDAARRRMLQEIAEEEARAVLRRAYQAYRGHSPEEIVNRLLHSRGKTARQLAVLFFAWRIGADEKALAAWLQRHRVPGAAEIVSDLFRAYDNRRLNLADYGYLLSLHPIDVWCAGEFVKNPKTQWEELYRGSAEARGVGSAWLLNASNRRAQDLRLRIRIEKDAFARMAPYWQRLGFPFKTVVPSYATAIGNSSDRPVALAELLGILMNDGVRRRATSFTEIHFARATPYETLFERTPEKGEQVLAPDVARAVRRAMAKVVEGGTARRLSGVFKLPDGRLLTVGGKTGSGDNRFETFNRSGGVITSRATNRTAAFVFYIGERYFGVITAYVEGREAANYHFTSALPVTILKLLAPTILGRLNMAAAQPPPLSSGEIQKNPAPRKIAF